MAYDLLRLSYMADDKEQLSLDAATKHILEECRMVLPGIQALFGFQLIAVFNQGFGEKLSTMEQQLHLLSIILTVTAVVLVMTPAALHRQIDPLAATRRFIESSTILLLFSMFPLSISICLDIYLIAHIITESIVLSLVIAAGLLLLFFSLWILLPYLKKSGRRSLRTKLRIAKEI
ncbi:MAG TPA: DUF6328 family protein [Candidatus Binatia bacterium]